MPMKFTGEKVCPLHRVISSVHSQMGNPLEHSEMDDGQPEQPATAAS